MLCGVEQIIGCLMIELMYSNKTFLPILHQYLCIYLYCMLCTVFFTKLFQVEEQEFEEFTVRILQATFEEKIRLVYQLHYNSWPDHGTPTNLDQILDMIALARQYQGDTGSPLVVHCR